jgi:putative ATPase
VLIESDQLSSVILWGPPGIGKTSLAEVMATQSSAHFVRLSAVSSGVKDIRETIAQAQHLLGEKQRRTMVFIDEIHRFSTSQQDALLPAVESGLLVLVGATTENPFFEVNAPLRSRSTLFHLEPLSVAHLSILVERGCAAENAHLDEVAKKHLLDMAQGDGRQILTSLEVACALARSDVSNTPGKQVAVSLADVEAALSTSALRYGRDDHYDVISAFIKSIRGSAVDAAIHWLARMLVAGEDPRFIARRLVILASEDIGMADPSSLLVATACAQAVEHVGMPEAQLNLAQATIHLASAPKSNSTSNAIWNAMSEVRSGGIGEVPLFLRDGHYQGAESLGHGSGYVSPHVATSQNPAAQANDYLPEALDGHRYYDEGL